MHLSRDKAKLEKRVHRPSYVKGNVTQAKTVSDQLTAWDEMTVAKNIPGYHNVSYVAGMNVTNLPTTTFAVANSIENCYHHETGI